MPVGDVTLFAAAGDRQGQVSNIRARDPYPRGDPVLVTYFTQKGRSIILQNPVVESMQETVLRPLPL